jgi:hypothetical protein
MNLKARKYHALEYFGVWEWHKDEQSIHYHMLMNGIDPTEFTPAIDMRETYVKDGKTIKNKFYGKQIVKKGKPVFNLNLMKFGFTTATRIESNEKTISYITKYITKQFSDRYLPYKEGCRRFINSRELKKPKRLSLDDEQLQKLLEADDSWLNKATNGLDFTSAHIIQELSDNQSLIAYFSASSVNKA